MRSIKVLGLAFFATLAFSVVGAIGAGSASALLFLTLSGLTLLFTIKGLGLAILETKSALAPPVECESTLGHGFILHKTDLADKILLTFHECLAVIGGKPVHCQTPGEPLELIMSLLLDALLVTLLSSQSDKYGLLLSAEKGNLAEFECGATKIEVRGTVAGEFEETLTESEEFKKEAKVIFEKGAGRGEQKIKDVETLFGVAADKLEANPLGFFEEANQQLLVDIIPDGPVKLDHGH